LGTDQVIRFGSTLKLEKYNIADTNARSDTFVPQNSFMGNHPWTMHGEFAKSNNFYIANM
jgi:hypothetical protein